MNISLKTGASLIGMISCAWLLRAIVFFCFIGPNSYYKQPDSPDYHACAITLARGNGMHHTPQHPIFWRTPGYPAFLAPFYQFFGPLNSNEFDPYQKAHYAALITQITLSCLAPILIFFLALTLTGSNVIAHLAGWLFVFHLGSILASTFLLTESLAVLFFYAFLLALFYALRSQISKNTAFLVATAALCLSGYTWIRPMGVTVGMITTVLLGIFAGSSYKRQLRTTLIFGALFISTLLPWYVRNYNLTNDWFFCPITGIYLNCFCVPKIISAVENIPLETAWKQAQQRAGHALMKAQRTCPHGKHLSPLLNGTVAWPIICEHPLLFLKDWIQENIKTAFDPYASQLTSIVKGSFYYDPLREFLSEKLAECLWLPTMPLGMQLICWFDMTSTFFWWLACLAGFALALFVYTTRLSMVQKQSWITSIILTGVVIGMTGGFGYARLRLPVEPLIIIGALLSCQWAIEYIRLRSAIRRTTKQPVGLAS